MTGNTCSCSTGFSVFQNGGGVESCVDTNACVGSPCDTYDSSAVCYDNAAPSTTYTCGCSSGYAFDGTTCVDDDACEPVNRCTVDEDLNATCIDAVPNAPNNRSYSCNCSIGFEPKLNATACRAIVDESSSSVVDPSSPAGMAMIVGAAAFVALVVVGFFVYRRNTKKNEAMANNMLKRAEHELQTVHASREFDSVDIFGGNDAVMCDLPSGDGDDDIAALKKRQKELERENDALRDDNSKHKKRLEKSDLYSERRESIPRMTGGFEEEPDIEEL
eukprot:g3016.t1